MKNANQKNESQHEEMQRLIKCQTYTKHSKYSKMIRESLEIYETEDKRRVGPVQKIDGELEKMPGSQLDDHFKYLQRKIDQKSYMKTIKSCNKAAKIGQEEWIVGNSKNYLKNALYRIVHNMGN